MQAPQTRAAFSSQFAYIWTRLNRQELKEREGLQSKKSPI